ncbi:MAG TPA: ABC transporter permease, partial [Vicinamibacterales bacterium]
MTPGYFSLLGIPMVEGRDFRPTDDNKAARVAIVNQTLAERYFPNGTAIGKKIWGTGQNRPAFDVVGVVADSRPDDLTKSAEPELYVPFWQARAFSKDLILRAEGDPKALVPAIEQALRSTDPTVAIENVRTLDDVRAESVSAQMFATRLLVAFAGAAIVLALVGLYGVLSLSVASRRREIAIRSAIGAQRGHIRTLVVGEGLRVVAWGLV